VVSHNHMFKFSQIQTNNLKKSLLRVQHRVLDKGRGRAPMECHLKQEDVRKFWRESSYGARMAPTICILCYFSMCFVFQFQLGFMYVVKLGV
jgi:hypothetical protein